VTGAGRPAGGWPLAALAVALGVAARARAVTAPDDAVKAAFVAKFGAFVQWPRAAARPAPTICVVGDDPVAADLERLKPSPAAPVEVRRLAAVDARSRCDLLYAAGGGRQPVSEALAAVAGRPVLTVTDARRSGARGMIHFVVRQDRVRFIIDAQQAERSGLQISAKLLALAESVKR
jgi:hypothetical protein